MKAKKLQINRITNNTDSRDIDEKCLGLDVCLGETSKLHTNRGLHIQIRHNRDKATYLAANEVAKLLSASTDMLDALENLCDLIKAETNEKFDNFDQDQTYKQAKAAIKKAKGK